MSSSSSSHSQPPQTPVKKMSQPGTAVVERVNQGRKSQASRLAASGILTQGQAKKLERDLEITQRNLEVFSELLSELQPGQVNTGQLILG